MANQTKRKPHPSWCGGVQGEKHEPKARLDKNAPSLGCTEALPGEPKWSSCYHRSFCAKCGKFLGMRVKVCPTTGLTIS